MLIFLYFAFRGTDFLMLWKISSHANVWWLLALLPPLLLSHTLRAWRWEYLLRPLKKDIRYRNLFSTLMVGYMMNNVLPKAGEIVRPYALGKIEGISRSAVFGTVLVERIFDILSFMLLIGFIPLVYSGPLNVAFPWLEEIGIWLTSATFAIFFFMIFLMIRRDLVERVLRFFTRYLSETMARKVERIAHSFLDGFLFLKDTGNYVVIILLSVLIWLLYIVMMFLPFFAFDLPRVYPQIDFSAAVVVQAISSLGIVIPTPGATGPYHYFTTQALTRLYGVNAETALSYATLTHAVAFIGTTLIGIFYFFKDKMHSFDMLSSETRGKPVTELEALR